MRSLIILEIEHGDDTDGLDATVNYVLWALDRDDSRNSHFVDYSVKVDIPACFNLQEKRTS